MSLLEDLKKEIETKESELKALKVAYDAVARMPNSAAPPTPAPFVKNANTSALSDTGVIDLDNLGIPEKAVSNKSTLYVYVKNLIQRFDKKEFTVNHVAAALQQMGKITANTSPKHHKNRVSAVIRKLSEEGVLERTHKGGGNDPHKYREVTQISLVNSES